jgi:hypothetical protein
MQAANRLASHRYNKYIKTKTKVFVSLIVFIIPQIFRADGLNKKYLGNPNKIMRIDIFLEWINKIKYGTIE